MRLIKKGFFFLVIFIVIGCASNDKDYSMDKECMPIIQSFFSRVATNNHSVALDSLLASNPFINTTDSSAIDLKNQFKAIHETSGKYIEFKVIRKRQIVDDIAIYSCLSKYESKFYRFVFIFYRATTNPKIYKFLFDDHIDVEIEESLKLYAE